MFRTLMKILVAAVSVVAFFCLIPVPSGATYTDSKQAHFMITIQIPETAPQVVVPEASVPDPTVSPVTPPIAERPSQAISPSAPLPNPPVVVQPPTPDPVVQPDPATVVQPIVPDPVVQPASPVVSDPAPTNPPVVDAPAPQEPIVTEPQPDPQVSPTPIDSEGLSNEEVSP